MNRMRLEKFPSVIYLFFAASILVGCSEDKTSENNDNESTLPNTTFRKIEVTETHESDAQPVTFTQTYLFDQDGRLENCETTQLIHLTEPFEMKNNYRITYGNQQVIISDESGNSSTYTLNEEGFATRCVRQESGGDIRNYTFDYQISKEGLYLLSKITETLPDEGDFSCIELKYQTPYSLYIAYHIGDFKQNYLAKISEQEAGDLKNLSEVPFLFLAELHPLSMHLPALYGKFLGEQPRYLYTEIEPENNELSNERVEYKYALDAEGLISSCQITTNSYGEEFKRTINYQFE